MADWDECKKWFDALSPGDVVTVSGEDYIKPDPVHRILEDSLFKVGDGTLVHFSRLWEEIENEKHWRGENYEQE